MHKIHFRPPDPAGEAKLTTLPRPLVGWRGNTPPHVSSLSTPSASRSRRIPNKIGYLLVPGTQPLNMHPVLIDSHEIVTGPRDNGFPGPAVALDGRAIVSEVIVMPACDGHTDREVDDV